MNTERTHTKTREQANTEIRRRLTWRQVGRWGVTSQSLGAAWLSFIWLLGLHGSDSARENWAPFDVVLVTTGVLAVKAIVETVNSARQSRTWITAAIVWQVGFFGWFLQVVVRSPAAWLVPVVVSALGLAVYWWPSGPNRRHN